MNFLQFKGTIIGMALGDGCLTGLESRRNNSRFRTTSIHKDYIEWKGKILEELTSVIYGQETETKWSTNLIYRVTTKQHPLYTSLYMRMYHNGGRTIDDHIIGALTPLGILFWYLDDGSYDSKLNQIVIASNRYSYSDHLVIAKVMNDIFKLRWNIHQKFVKRTGKRYCSLYLSAKDRLRFYELIIEPYVDQIPLSLKYKVPSKQRLIDQANKHDY
jgi:hypothetical protein